ncbi:MAG: 2-dehydropantoate 2-reductase [Chloroflexi bacterium]|nr:2-dehydropantoate 2-reductase [Chloroflexota bacterium]
MKIAIMATGGLGGYYGALLAKDGHDVTFIARGAHLKVIREHGLTIKSIHGDFAIKPAFATDNPSEVGVVDYILFGVKTYDTVAAAQSMQPMIGEKTTVVNFQNGVDSHEQIAEVIGKEHIIVAPTQVVSNITAPGLIEQKSPFRSSFVGEVYKPGLTPRVQEFTAMLKRTGVDATAVADGRTPLWHKFVFIASIAGLATLARTEPFILFQMPEARAMLRAAMEEVCAVGKAQGVAMDGDIVDRHYNGALNLKPGNKPSMQLDLEQGKQLEIDALSGMVVRLGAEKNVPTPVHQTIYVGLKLIDERTKQKGKS